MEEYWTLERVIQWLEINNFRSAIEIFKANRISGRAFLDFDSSYLMTCQNELSLPERNKLIQSIKSITRVKDHYASPYNNRSAMTPRIPERKSSTNEHVLNLVKNIPIPTKLPIGSAAARHTNSRARSTNIANNNTSNWNSTRRPNTIETSIHVTTDSDTFHSLQVTGMRDPRLIKTSILRKLGLGVECNKFLFFHENGKHPNVPLFDNELSFICQNSDHSSTNRILVQPKSGHYTTYCIDGTKYRDFAPTHKRKPTNHSAHLALPNHYHQENLNPNGLTNKTWAAHQQHQRSNTIDTTYYPQPYPTPEIVTDNWNQNTLVSQQPPWVVSQSQEKSSLWAVPPKLSKSTSDSLIPSSRPDKPSSSLWAVPPKTIEGSNSTQLNNTTTTSSLWAVPPKALEEEEIQQFSSENLNLHPSISSKTEEKPKRAVRFHENEGRGLHVDTGIRSASPTPASCSPSGIEENHWAERPSVERLYKNIDKYLPGHDLDKEIIVEPSTLLPKRHKKSIRHVANEAHRNWRNAVNAVNVIRANHLIRRRSTKMWHRAVEQVKPGMNANVHQPGELPKSKKLQWIRGELIGKGSFGRVYHALNVEAGEWIAVKQVDLPTTQSDYAKPGLREIKDGLFREISLLEDLDNEYIVQYLGYNVDEEEGHINIFLEYVPGGSIASCLSKTGRFEVALVQFFTRQILSGLAYLHNRNVLHRDIKAGNILLDQNGICKITDFGLSKLSGQDKAYDPHSNNSVMRGTVFWMAPEVVKGTNYNAKVDIWSLGCTVIEMLTGNHPWLDLNMLAALYNLGKYQAPPIPEDIPESAKNFLTKCFTINPEERPTAEQLLNDPFVQPDPTFEFKKYMKKAEVERRTSKGRSQ